MSATLSSHEGGGRTYLRSLLALRRRLAVLALLVLTGDLLTGVAWPLALTPLTALALGLTWLNLRQIPLVLAVGRRRRAWLATETARLDARTTQIRAEIETLEGRGLPRAPQSISLV